MKRFLLPVLLVLSVLSLPLLRARWAWERGDKGVTLCVDGPEVDALFPEPAERAQALKDLLAAGVGSVGVLWDGTVSLNQTPADWEGFSITWRPALRKFSEGGHPLPWKEWLPPRALCEVRPGSAPDLRRQGFLLPSGSVSPSPGPDSPLAFVMENSLLVLPVMEFSRDPAVRALASSFRERVVRGHSIDEEELLHLSPDQAVLRFRRAVRERGARFLYVHLFPGLLPAANLSYVSGLADALRSDGFTLAPASPRSSSAPRGFPGPTGARQLLAFLAAALGPWLVFRRWKDRPLFLAPFSLLAALLTAAVLSSPEFLLGLADFRGVKAALVIPFLLAAGGLYTRDEIKTFFRRPLTVGNAAALAAFAFAAAVYLFRSGNVTPLPASGLELRVRDALESFLSVRPRFKEFALGWPLLWLGAFLSSKGRDARPLLLLGLVAPVSVVNTFCHAHVPLEVSLLRVFNGFWLGTVFGLALIAFHRWSAGRFPAPSGGPAPRRR